MNPFLENKTNKQKAQMSQFLQDPPMFQYCPVKYIHEDNHEFIYA